MAPTPITSLPAVPPAQAEPPKLPRPEPEIYRVETPSPLQIEPVGPKTASIADSLATLAEAVNSPTWPPTWPAAAATANADANASTAAAGTAAEQATRPQPSVSAPSAVVSQWATDLLAAGLTALLAGTGIALPAGAAGLAAWAVWTIVRRLAKRKVSSLAASFQAQNSGAPSTAFPHLPVDYAKIWADHYEHDGGNAAHEALKCDLYREAIGKMREGVLAVPANDPRGIADKIDDWVLEEFFRRVSYAVPNENIYQRALMGFLYRQAVDALRRGEIVLLGCKEMADAIDAWVRREFARRVLGRGV